MGMSLETQVIHAFFIQLFLGSLLIAGLIAAGYTRPKLAVQLAAIVALVLLVVGVVLYDTATGLRYEGYQQYDQALLHGPLGLWGAVISSLAIATGGSLSFAASVLGLRGAAQRARWAWFAVLAVFTVMGVVAAVSAYDTVAFLAPTKDLRFAVTIGPEVDSSKYGLASTTYFLVWSILVAIAPLGALLFGIFGPDLDSGAARLAPTRPLYATLPASSPRP
jgi:hypothetical protein